MTLRNRILKAHPATLVLGTFLLAIVVGALVLKLPISTRTGSLSVVDALFTSTSAVCVTGLVVVDTGSYFSTFGQCAILLLIQIGGLGVMTISVAMFRWIGRSVSIRHRVVMQDLFAHTPREDIFGLVKSIVLFTLAAELLGAVALTIHWAKELPFPTAVYTAVFHSVSAFCNAGFALFGDSMMRYRDNLLLNSAVCLLIVVGGIGFPVLYDLQSWFVRRRKERVRLSIQTKTVLITTVVLICSGALMFALLERDASLRTHSFSSYLLVSLFQSITCRTAGFNTVDIASLREATLAMMMVLMFFGASPGSCGGGVKTTTLALLTAFTVGRVKREHRVNMFKKSIPTETVTRSVSLVLLAIGMMSMVLFMLLVGDMTSGRDVGGPQHSFLGYFFETVSAFGTVGLSMGVTPELGTWGKYWIIFMMVVGRVGVLTFAYIITGTRGTKGIEYSEENVMIG
jgi:trk system potassium uptake protein TrkH